MLYFRFGYPLPEVRPAARLITRIFSKILANRLRFSKNVSFNFVHIRSQISIRTARSLRKFIVSENSFQKIASLFATSAAYQLNQITV